MYAVARIYESEHQANEAGRKLIDAGFSQYSIYVVTPRSEGDPDAMGAIVNAIGAGNALGDDFELYARGVGQGYSLVVVRTNFGYSRRASAVLDSCHPMPTGGRRETETLASRRAAPLSSSLGLSVLTDGSPAPFSDYLGLPTQSRGLSWMSYTFGEIGRSSFSLSSLFGFGMLSRNPTPLSSLIGFKPLTRSKGPWKSSFGMPLLSSNPAPLSSMFGLPTLSKNPAPFSSLFGLRTLSIRDD